MQEIRKSRNSEKKENQKSKNQKKSEIGEKKIKQGKNIDQLGHG